MAAHVIEICDACVAVLSTVWAPVAPNSISRIYGKEIGLSIDYPAEMLTGRQIYVFPTNYNQYRLLDRKSKLTKYSVSVLIAERYTEAGLPPVAWMDERVSFVDSVVFSALTDLSASFAGARVDPEDLGSVDIVYDRDLYMQRNTFWSQITIVYQEPR
jgi:hypothetical protein